MSRVFLIDTDTASDDAIALIMAMRAPDVHIAAITAVSGNVDVRQAASNALYVAELCDVTIPVYVGADKPLNHPNVHAYWYHGSDGLGGHGFRPQRTTPEAKEAIEAIVDTISENPGLTLVALGPLTNIALALHRRPDIVRNVARCVVMGGAYSGGNVTPAAEYNIWIDPDAAHIVLRSGLPVELIGLDLCRGEAVLNSSEVAQLESLPGKLGRFAVRCCSRGLQTYFEQNGSIGLSVADPVAMAIALTPSIATRWGEHYVEVETVSELTRGETVVDRHDVATNERNRGAWRSAIASGSKTRVCWAINPQEWKQALTTALTP
jgi:purine nucleosidase